MEEVGVRLERYSPNLQVVSAVPSLCRSAAVEIERKHWSLCCDKDCRHAGSLGGSRPSRETVAWDFRSLHPEGRQQNLDLEVVDLTTCCLKEDTTHQCSLALLLWRRLDQQQLREMEIPHLQFLREVCPV